jgi:putative chitinase
MTALTLEIFKKLWPHGNAVIPGLMEGVIASQDAIYTKYGIKSDLVVAHMFAQFSEECGAGLEMIENMNYSAARLLQVFPSHFTSAQAIELQHNPRAIADKAYGGRMGNRIGTDDGWNFRGQGFSQLTGRDNYVSLSKTTELDLVNHPEFLRTPEHALECGVGDFIQCGCLRYAETDNLIGVSSMLNVGHFVGDTSKINGFSMRKSWLNIWKHALGV